MHGPRQTTYSYTASFAAGFGEGPAEIRVIWGDSKVIYVGQGVDLWDAETEYAVGALVNYNSGIWQALDINTAQAPYNGSTHWLLLNTSTYPAPVIWRGDEDQIPDSTIQASEGVNVTPAFRGLCYAIWEDFPLANFSNRIPNIRAELEYLLPDGSHVTGPADMVNDLCLRAGLATDQIDVSQL